MFDLLLSPGVKGLILRNKPIFSQYYIYNIYVFRGIEMKRQEKDKKDGKEKNKIKVNWCCYSSKNYCFYLWNFLHLGVKSIGYILAFTIEK